MISAIIAHPDVAPLLVTDRELATDRIQLGKNIVAFLARLIGGKISSDSILSLTHAYEVKRGRRCDPSPILGKMAM